VLVLRSEDVSLWYAARWSKTLKNALHREVSDAVVSMKRLAQPVDKDLFGLSAYLLPPT